MKVPFFIPHIDKKDIESVTAVMKSGWLTMGEKTFLFEKKFSEYIGVKNAIMVNSGTSALHIILNAMGIGRGDEVLIPTNTFIATAEAVEYCGAKPVLVDIDKETLNINPEEIKKKITHKTKAIIPVHIAGHPADMDPIMEIAREYNIAIIEDAAHALPSEYKNTRIGRIGQATAFSFYATKTLVTGEGGMVTTNDDELAEKIRRKRLHGIDKDAWKRYSEKGSWRYDVTTLGFKYNPTDIAAALGLSQLEKLHWMWEKRKKAVEKYIKLLRECTALELPVIKEYATQHSWHLFIIRLSLEKLRISRDSVIEILKEKGIGTSVHFIPLHRFTHFKEETDAFPVADSQFEKIISLPLFPNITDEMITYTSETLINILRKNIV